MKDAVIGEQESEQFECYDFNVNLSTRFDDGLCEHCRKYLTINCPHIDTFIGEEGLEEEF